MLRQTLLLLPLLTACAAAPRPVPRPSTQPAEAGDFVLQPSTALRACVGARETRLFSTDAAGRTEARALADGKLLWTVAGKGQVVCCDDELVLTAHVTDKGLTLHGLAVADGKERWTHSRKLPAWVSDSNISFTAWKDERGYGVHWSALTYWQGGYPPSPEEERAAHREAKGAFVLSPGGETREVRGQPFKPAKVPAALQKQFPGRQGRFTWDGAHVCFREGKATVAVNLKSRARSTVPVVLGSVAARLYLTRDGKALLVTTDAATPEERADKYSIRRAVCWDRQGQQLWSAELYRERVPEPVP